jgi:hypothetical protein
LLKELRRFENWCLSDKKHQSIYIENQKKMKTNKVILGIACAMLGMLPTAFGQYSESFESGTPDGWNLDSVNGSTPAVNTVRASDGIYSVENSFAVSPSFAGFSVTPIIDYGNARNFINANTTTLSVDVYSDWANPAGWGVYNNSITLVLNYQGGYQVLSATSGSLVNGSFETLTFDLTPWAATISNPSLSYDQMQIAWRLGTYSDNNGNNGYLASGTQDFSIDHITTVEAVPEPATSALAAMGGAALLFLRRRSVR